MKTTIKFIKFIFTIALLSTCSHIRLISQNVEFRKNYLDSILAVQYFNIADTAYLNVTKCFRYTKLAIPLLYKTHQYEKYQYCLNSLNYCYEKLEDFESLEQNNIFAYEEAQRLFPPSHALRIGATNNLANVYKSHK